MFFIKRSDTEFDSETESVCSNSQLPSSKLSDHPINTEQLLEELAKGRLRSYPYTNFENWTDDRFWVTLMKVMFPYTPPRHYTAPSMRDVMGVILQLQEAYKFRNYDAMTPQAILNLEVVFGPEYDNGPFESHLVNPAFLPWSETTYEGEEEHAMALNLLPRSEYDTNSSSDGGVITWEKQPIVLGSIIGNPIESPVRNEKKKKERKMERAGESSSLHSNFQSLARGRHFSRSQFGIIDKNDVSLLFYQDVKVYSAADQALLLFHCSPSSARYGSMLLLPASERKKALQEFLQLIKQQEPPESPTHYRVLLPKI